MAQMAGLKPQEPFDFKNPDDWPWWRRRFQQYREALGLDTASTSKQSNTLLYCLEEESESVLISTNIFDNDCKDYSKVLEKFDNFFKVRENIIYERARFHRRNKQVSETAEQYIIALYELLESCKYRTLIVEMIRDSLVVGICDSALSEKLQMDSKLTLDTAKKMICQREAVHEQ